MTQESKTDVLICGAGAAGLSLAIDLARRGLDFRLIEKAVTPFDGSRGKGIQPRSLEVFEDYGIVDRLFATGGPYPPIREYRPDGSFVDSPFSDARRPTPAEPYRAPLMVPQFLTEGVMRERLAELGHRPEFGRELTGFSQDAEGVTAQVGGEVVRARYLVGTDGGRSFVRHALGVDFPGETLGVRAIVADVELEGIGRDAWHRFGSGTQPDLAVPARRHRTLPGAGPGAAGGRRRSHRRGTDGAGRRTDRPGHRHPIGRLGVSVLDERAARRPLSGRPRVPRRRCRAYPSADRRPGPEHQRAGQLQLGWKLAAVLGGAPEKLLATYEEERRPIAAGMLGLATRLLDEVKQGTMRRGRETRQLDLGYSGRIAGVADARA